MLTLSLNGTWEFRQTDTADWLPATVPGNNFTDLIANKKIPDPFFGDNENRLQWVAEKDWEYRRTFEVSKDLLASERVLLECDGLDTHATLYINGKKAGTANNMFHPWVYDVKALLTKGKNEIRIVFHSFVQYARKIKNREETMIHNAMNEVTYTRKAACHAGWDWGPTLPPSGIWRAIRLAGRNAGQLDQVLIHQVHKKKSVDVEVHALFTKFEALEDRIASARFTLTGPNGFSKTVEEKETAGIYGVDELLAKEGIKRGKEPLEIAEFDQLADHDRMVFALKKKNKTHKFEFTLPHEFITVISIDNPQLWWPNGYGEQPLYSLVVELLDDKGNVVDTQTKRIGLRTLELEQKKDKWGQSFTFVVNGVRIFAKGANWIPADSFPNRVTQSRYAYLLQSARDANMNMMRVWGGGYYEEEGFYDLCDELGLLVWQDFMFACGIYPTDKAFIENFRQEAVHNVRRLRHRACLAIWCGNNEMEQGWCDWGWQKKFKDTKRRMREYENLFYKWLPEWVNAEDGVTPYWPSSASSNEPFKKPNGEVKGDGHYWEVWFSFVPFTEYRKHYYRFQSEFGFQSLPPYDTVKAYAEAKDLSMTSRIMEHHQRHTEGNGKIMFHLTRMFRIPKDFASLCYVSMIQQGEAIRSGVEHWRRNSHRVSGALFWQINDIWPVCSWSSIDYFGRWKALHYAAKRFFEPVLVSAEENGTKVDLHVTNDRREPFWGTLTWRLETFNGTVVRQGEKQLKASAGKNACAAKLDFKKELPTPESKYAHVFVYELHDDQSARVGSGTIFFAPSKYLELEKPEIKTEVTLEDRKLVIKLSSSTLARYVYLSFEDRTRVFSDNYFDLPPNTERMITCDVLQGGLEESLARLRVTSLYESF